MSRCTASSSSSRPTRSAPCSPRSPGSARSRTPRSPRGEVCLLAGTLPAANVHALQQQLPGLTRGEGVMESAFERYAVMASSWTG